MHVGQRPLCLASRGVLSQVLCLCAGVCVVLEGVEVVVMTVLVVVVGVVVVERDVLR